MDGGEPDGHQRHLPDLFTWPTGSYARPVGPCRATRADVGRLRDGNEHHGQYHQHEPTDKHKKDDLLGQPTRARHRPRGGSAGDGHGGLRSSA